MCTGDQLLTLDIQNESFAKIKNEHSLQILVIYLVNY